MGKCEKTLLVAPCHPDTKTTSNDLFRKDKYMLHRSKPYPAEEWTKLVVR